MKPKEKKAHSLKLIENHARVLKLRGFSTSGAGKGNYPIPEKYRLIFGAI